MSQTSGWPLADVVGQQLGEVTKEYYSMGQMLRRDFDKKQMFSLTKNKDTIDVINADGKFDESRESVEEQGVHWMEEL
jgi:uncharacterized tellurite resistance protein B-like protein